MKTENKTQWITQYEVLQMLNISRATLLRWRQKGYLPSYRFHNSRIIFFDADEVDSFIRKHHINPQTHRYED